MKVLDATLPKLIVLYYKIVLHLPNCFFLQRFSLYNNRNNCSVERKTGETLIQMTIKYSLQLDFPFNG